LLDKNIGLGKKQIGYSTDNHCFIYRTADNHYEYFNDSKELRDAISESNIRAILHEREARRREAMRLR
jgi:hypothetical protein